VWDATVDGRKLTFHLAGINNQNFIMRDEETGTWWQQVSGEAVLGPLKGRRLSLIAHDELLFSVWRREQPEGRVLMPDEKVANKYAPADWEDRVGRMPVVTPVDQSDGLAPRELIVGLTAGGLSKAYTFSKLQQHAPVSDTVGEVPIIIVMDDDKKSVRVFERTVDGRTLTFSSKPAAPDAKLTDDETGSSWSFAGKAISGPLAGRQLRKMAAISDYWFDWKTYHPDTAIY
ncbi:MAG TPA: DUF3179 domain-containing (seleno)protein, partial [Blastocatellia bacterium]|nr:DUF3179 domain-containing (seleno)protein [Blastocatellia bacterium]